MYVDVCATVYPLLMVSINSFYNYTVMHVKHRYLYFVYEATFIVVLCPVRECKYIIVLCAKQDRQYMYKCNTEVYVQNQYCH